MNIEENTQKTVFNNVLNEFISKLEYCREYTEAIELVEDKYYPKDTLKEDLQNKGLKIAIKQITVVYSNFMLNKL